MVVVFFSLAQSVKQQNQSQHQLKAAQYYVNARWLGGTLTNWSTISNSIKRLRELEAMLESPEAASFTKKERLTRTRELEKLERCLLYTSPSPRDLSTSRMPSSA